MSLRPARVRTARAAALALAAVALAAFALLVATPAAAQTPCAAGYTIRPGDTLAEIATRCGVTIPALLATNPGVADDQDLEAGGRLRMPAPGTRPTPIEACGGFYTLRPGDTLEEVAEKCGLTIPLLIAANAALEDPDNVVPGGRVRIPDLPRRGTAGPPVIVMRPPDSVAATAAVPSLPADSVEPAPFARHEGVLIRGERCLLIRGADGTDVGLVGPPARGFAPGDRIVVTGPAADGAQCGTAAAVEVRILWKRGTPLNR